MYVTYFELRSTDPMELLAVDIVLERLAQSINAAIISDTIFGNKRKTNVIIHKIILLILIFQNFCRFRGFG